jgi:hypothetical protein
MRWKVNKTSGHISFLLLLIVIVAGVSADVRINEVAFDEPAGTPDWVELYNDGPEDVFIDGWRLDDHDAAAGNEIVLRLAAPVPPGGFVVVRVDAAGEDDADPSDGLAVLYTGTATTVSLAATEDELALYRAPAKSSATLEDFVAWVTDGDYGGLADQSNALSAGRWPPGAAVVLDDAGRGYSVGRRRDGDDRDVPEDFRDYLQPTPGAPNRGPAPPSDVGALWIPDDLNPFNPDDPDPSRRALTLGFRASTDDTVKSLRLLDRRGRLLRRWIDEDVGEDGRSWSGLAEGVVVWDGRTNEGDRLPVGLYVVVFEAVPPAGAPVFRRRLVALGAEF